MSRRRFAALGCAWPIESVEFPSILQRLRLILAESKISCWSFRSGLQRGGTAIVKSEAGTGPAPKYPSPARPRKLNQHLRFT
jgi:hypothetical protein